MSLYSGFFNSFNGDRRYSAEQISAIFDGVINDGIFANIGTAFSVTADADNDVIVGVGRCWFNSTWLYNDTLFPVVGYVSDVVLDRIDALVIEVDRSDSVRDATIKMVKGTPSSSPQRPAMIRTDDCNQYPLAYIYKKAGATGITQADITSMIGTSECPYVTGILQVQNIDNIVAQWKAQWDQWFLSITADAATESSEWFTATKAEFELWLDSLQILLDGNTAAKFAADILELQNRFETLAKESAVYEPIEDSNGSTITDSYDTTITGRTMFGAGSGDNDGSKQDIESIKQDIKTIRQTIGDGDISAIGDGTVKGAILGIRQAFQDGCDTIVSGCTTYGDTPDSNSPADIVKSIGNIYDARYNSGRTQGQSDVTSNPNAYSLYTASQYTSYGTNQYNSGRTQGRSDVTSNPGAYGLYVPPKTQTGSVTLYFGAYQAMDYVFTFSSPFLSTPSVNASARGYNWPAEVSYSIKNITKAGFTLYVNNRAGQPQNIGLSYNAVV